MDKLEQAIERIRFFAAVSERNYKSLCCSATAAEKTVMQSSKSQRSPVSILRYSIVIRPLMLRRPYIMCEKSSGSWNWKA